MSVGYNIIDGIKDIMKSNPAIKLNIQETTDISKFNNGVFAHSRNGENVKPKTKVDAFVKTMDSGLAKQVDIAFFKFCYVDFNKNTDVNDLFKYYTSAMDATEEKISEGDISSRNRASHNRRGTSRHQNQGKGFR